MRVSVMRVSVMRLNIDLRAPRMSSLYSRKEHEYRHYEHGEQCVTGSHVTKSGHRRIQQRSE